MCSERILSIGNIKDVDIRLNKPAVVISNKRKEKLKILWCTNMIEYSIKEYSIMREVLLEDPNFELYIRLHPSYDVTEQLRREIIDEMILCKTIFTNNKDIVSDIRNCDLVITNDVSSVFFDAVLEQKPVVRIISNLFINDSLGLDKATDIIFDVDQPFKLKIAIEKIRNNNLQFPEPSYMKEQFDSVDDIHVFNFK